MTRGAEMASQLLVLLVAPQLVSGFWFTENTFTYQPAAPAVKDAAAAAAADSRQQTSSNSSANLEVLTKTEPWIRLGQSNEQQQQQCQCNLDWLQNQTSLWLAKWLDKAQAQVAAGVAKPLSNSTGAIAASNINRRANNNNALGRGGPAGNHWGSWVSRSGGQLRSGAHANRAPIAGGKQQQQLQLKLAQGPRGPPGPKGEQGPRGEPGPPGPRQTQQLVRVADRDALFDLETSNSSGLVFVEAEQVLVVATQSGWRPLQLAGPLRDFRRTIAKFSVPARAAGERRRPAGDNLIGPSHLPEPDELADELEEDEDDEEEDDDEEDDDDEDDVDDVDDRDAEDELDQGPDDNRLRPGDKSSAPALVAASMGSPSLARPLPAPVAAPLVAAGPAEAAAPRRPKLRLAALNEPFSGNVHGIRGADFECRRQASRANIKGSFRALLSSSFQALGEIVRHNVHKYPVVNLRDEALAGSWHELLRQPVRVANPLSRIYSFSGRHVASHSNWPNKLVWHGAATKLGQREPVHNCDGWHSDSLAKFGWATPIHAPRNPRRKSQKRKRFAMMQNSTLPGPGDDTNSPPSLLEVIDKYPCRMPLVVLCIETVGQLGELAPARSSNQIN